MGNEKKPKAIKSLICLIEMDKQGRYLSHKTIYLKYYFILNPKIIQNRNLQNDKL